jgi:predicted nucleic acid-binding protein
LVRVYLDTCVWCRPFDRPAQRVTEEAKAARRILSLADREEVEILSSGLVLFEASFIKPVEKRESVTVLIRKSSLPYTGTMDVVEELAQKLIDECGLDALDAAHVAVAINGEADTFLTTDDGILNKGMCVSKFGIIVKNPVDFEV